MAKEERPETPSGLLKTLTHFIIAINKNNFADACTYGALHGEEIENTIKRKFPKEYAKLSEKES